MEKLDQELDLLTGVNTQTGFDGDKLTIHKRMDLTPLTDVTNAMRNSDDYSREGIKRGFFHVASIDPITQVELLQMGVDIYRSSAKELVAGLRRLNKDQLITTRKQV